MYHKPFYFCSYSHRTVSSFPPLNRTAQTSCSVPVGEPILCLSHMIILRLYPQTTAMPNIPQFTTWVFSSPYKKSLKPAPEIISSSDVLENSSFVHLFLSQQLSFISETSISHIHLIFTIPILCIQRDEHPRPFPPVTSARI